MVYILIGIAFLIAACMSAFVIPQVAFIAYDKKLFDEPGGRKIHTKATPRLGGIVFFPVVSFTLFLVIGVDVLLTGVPSGTNRLPGGDLFFLFCGLLLLNLVGIKDDLYEVKYRAKFIIQLIVAVLISVSGFWIDNLHGFLGVHALPPYMGVPLTILVFVSVINSINLIDGIDGLASGLCMICLATLGVAFLIGGAWLYALLAFVTIGVLIPFFIYNVFGKPGEQKIFMGDTGSLTLGCVIAFLAIGLMTMTPDTLPYSDEVIVIAFGSLVVPIFDVCRVILVRARRKKHLFTADKNHIHHKFLMMGFTSRRTMVAILFMAAFFNLLNIILCQFVNCTFVLLIDVVLWVGLHLWLNRLISKKERREMAVEVLKGVA